MGCGRHVPNDDELVAVLANQRRRYPESHAAYGPLRDVEFPFGAACEAIAACRELAELLRTDLTRRGDTKDRGGEAGTMVRQVTKDWQGPARDDFVLVWGSQIERLVTAETTLTTLAGALEDAWDEAVAENGRRATNREEYDNRPAASDPNAPELY